jgi:hypothetical protein
MDKYEKFQVHEDPSTVFVDWEYALRVCETLDRLEDGEDRHPISGKAAVRILAEYAATAHRCSWPPSTVGLIIVVCPPSVWFCPTSDPSKNGLFIEEYSENKHGQGVQFLGKDHLFDFCSISASLDGWQFCSEMTFAKENQNA